MRLSDAVATQPRIEIRVSGGRGAPGADSTVPGPPGDDGVGVPAGGSTGQLMAKTSGADFATGWVDPPDLSLYLLTSNFTFANLGSKPTTLAGFGITDAVPVSQKGVVNGVAQLDSGGKVPASQLPTLAITEVYTVASQVAQLALTADEGDVAIRTDLTKSFIHNGGTAGTMADWSELLMPTVPQYRNLNFFITTPPTASETLYIFVCNDAAGVTLADDFAGSTASVGTNPTGSFVLTVKKNGSSVGTITISTGGAVTFVTTGTTVALASGDRLTVEAQASVDATLANVAINLKGVVA